MKLRSIAAVVACSFAISLAPSAHADLDIDRAGKDAHGYTQPGQQAGFCTHPSKLAKDADQMCPLANDTGCEGFQKMCANASHEPPKPKEVDSDDNDGLSKMFGGLARLLMWLMLIAVAVVAIVLVVQAFRRAKEDQKLADAKPITPKLVDKPAPEGPEAPVITDAELLLRRAAELARAGEHERALYTYLEASLRALDTRGAVRITKDRTYGEYVRFCKEVGAKAPLGDIVREVDRVKFGGAQASAETAQLAGDRATRLVRFAAMALLALFVGGGCGGSKVARTLADDPNGTDVLVDLLKRQGIEAGSLRGSLARLPMPVEGEETPAIMVDFERTKVDEGTRTHLYEWAKAGGTLIISSSPGTWPKELAARYQSTSSTKVTATVLGSMRYDEEGNELGPKQKTYTAKVAGSDALEMKCDLADPMDPRTNTLAWIGDDRPFASFCFVGDGLVIGVANFDLFTNVGMMPPGNAEVAFAILSKLRTQEVRIAQPMDGIEPPSSPISSIDRAGLGLGMWHALAAAIVLFFAIGARLSRAAKSPPDARRAFTEHVEATGLVYARAKAASHALAAYAKFVDERIRGMMPRGVNDPAAFLALRSGAPADECHRVFDRATKAKGGEVRGDELDVLRRLTTLYANAVRRG